MATDKEVRYKIIEAAIKVFNEHGIKFTMDDVASELSMSKKTIYKFFNSKEQLVKEAVDFGFAAVKESEQEIINDKNIDIVEKMRRTIIAMPDKYRGMDWRRLYEFSEPYPEAYAAIQRHIETGWENTIELLNMGIAEGKIKPINITVFKNMIQSSIEGFIRGNELINAGISYEDALNSMIDIAIDGIRK